MSRMQESLNASLNVPGTVVEQDTWIGIVFAGVEREPEQHLVSGEKRLSNIFNDVLGLDWEAEKNKYDLLTSDGDVAQADSPAYSLDDGVMLIFKEAVLR